MAAFNRDHTKARICSVGSNQPNGVNSFLRYNDQTVLTQIPLAYALANCGGCFIHSSGVVLDGKGVLFVGCSGAGKSTIKRMILSNSRAEPLCDERNIIRKWPDGYQVHGVWANKDLSDVSATSSPLGAIMFLEQSNENRVSPIGNRIDIIKRLLTCVLGPAESAEWWDKSLKIMGDIAKDIPCYRVNFDLSGQIVKLIEDAVSRI